MSRTAAVSRLNDLSRYVCTHPCSAAEWKERLGMIFRALRQNRLKKFLTDLQTRQDKSEGQDQG